MKKVSLIIVVLLIFFVAVTDTYAHKVQMFAYPEGENIFVEGYFADGKKPKKSEVVVYDNGGNVLFNGVTDDEGKLSFKIPQKTDMRITLNAGMGHKTEYTIPASELSGSNPPLSPFKKGGEAKSAIDKGGDRREAFSKGVGKMVAVDKGGEAKGVIDKVGEKNMASDKGGETKSTVNTGEASDKTRINQLDEAQIQAIVERAVEKAVGEAIKPLVRSFTEMTQKNSLTTIIGGIGYIFGFMGIALYFKSRKG